MNEIRDIHEPFIAWLRKRGIPYHRNRPDKKTTAMKGDPDFLVMWMSHGVYIECKMPGKKPSPDQEKRIAYIRRAGNKVVIACSIEECIEACENILCRKEDLASSQENGLTTDSDSSADGRSRVQTGGDVPAGQPKLFIANVAGKDCVCRGSGKAGTEFEVVRRATPADVINIR